MTTSTKSRWQELSTWTGVITGLATLAVPYFEGTAVFTAGSVPAILASIMLVVIRERAKVAEQ